MNTDEDSLECPPSEVLAVISEKRDHIGKVQRRKVEGDSTLSSYDEQAIASTIEELKSLAIIEESENGELSRTFQ